MAEIIQSIRGFPDILPPLATKRAAVCLLIRRVLGQFGYQVAELPILEKTALFVRSIGGDTDIVGKEMYSFEDRNGDNLSLRPEGTAGMVRAVIENGLLQQVSRFFVEGEMFRHERPQEGRTRQFKQISVECFGIETAALDAELLAIGEMVFQELEIRNAVNLEINSIGLAEERVQFIAALREYLSRYENDLDTDSKRRLTTNPLRILDSKDAKTKEILLSAPNLSDFLGAESQKHFEDLRGYLEALDIKYVINPRLVRGLDYYCHSVFEWTTRELGAQGTICAGGRYNGLVEELGGKATPAAGFAFGIDRISLLKEKIAPTTEKQANFYILATSEKEQITAIKWARDLRAKFPELTVICHNQFQALKKQLRKADMVSARAVLIFGEAEVAVNQTTYKNLQTGEQKSLSFEQLCQLITSTTP
ncbi:MAG: histidine--tRNA ligase [Cardiobacteriaceae bacterium]|nr:histidine--tRNA ligase [Cardiobacteriaceae bacterium]